MTREEAGDMLDDLIDKYDTKEMYERRDDYCCWTQAAENKAVSDYEELKERIIDLICKEVEK